MRSANVHFPDTPSNTITYRPSVLLIDTITYIASALGVWFGFSYYLNKEFSIRSDNSKRLYIDAILGGGKEKKEGGRVIIGAKRR